jgi:hypothetical protein
MFGPRKQRRSKEAPKFKNDEGMTPQVNTRKSRAIKSRKNVC